MRENCAVRVKERAMKSAVLVIDVQQGLCEGEGAAFDCEGTIARINAVTHKARQASVPVILVSDAHTSAGNVAISAQQVIAHQNATLTDITSFGPRVTAVPSADIVFA